MKLPDSVFVWTVKDVFGLIVLACFALVVIIGMLKEVWRGFVDWLKKKARND